VHAKPHFPARLERGHTAGGLRAAARAFILIAILLELPLSAGASGARIDSELALSSRDLRAAIHALPNALQERILAHPDLFLRLLARVLDEPAELFVLVDKAHALPADYVPPDLVSPADYSLNANRSDVLLRKTIMGAAVQMSDAARADGVTLLFSSGYRSYETQRVVYQAEVAAYGQAAADRESARPGLSQHQLGTAIDLGSITDAFADTRAGKWLAAHAEEYGFSLSYPDGYESVTGYRHESWHYRYITRAGTRLQKEYFGDVQQYMLEFLDANWKMLEEKRRTH
jgi:D-alanyl-D-alanine carboxypeptidase